MFQDVATILTHFVLNRNDPGGQLWIFILDPVNRILMCLMRLQLQLLLHPSVYFLAGLFNVSETNVSRYLNFVLEVLHNPFFVGGMLSS